MAASIQFGGLITGLDTKTLIAGLVQVEQQPTKLLQNQKVVLQAKDAVFTAVAGALGSFRSAAQNLSVSTDFSKRNTDSSDSTVLTASADSGASLGSHLVTVDTLAKAQTLRSTSFTDSNGTLGTGSLTIDVGSTATSITVDNTNNTLSGLRDTINNSGANISASVINVGPSGSPDYRLVLYGKETGTVNAFTVSGALAGGADPFVGGAEIVQAATDAKFAVDGLTVTRSSNTISDVISGVTFVLRNEGDQNGTIGASDPSSKITIGSDPSALQSSVKSLVDSYNAVNQLINNQFKVDSNTNQQGAVGGDASLKGVISRLRQELGASGGNGSGFKYLSDIGVSFQKDGSLMLDNAKLAGALEKDTTSVANLFVGLQNGIGKRIPNAIDEYINVATGTLTLRQKGNAQSIKQIDDKVTRENTRIAAYQERLTQQFSALEKIVGQLKSQGDYLTQQFAALAKA
jgi:flagellar hook-associated protein 2